MRALLAFAAAFLLSGCWHGNDLFGPADAQHVVAPGLYRGMVRPDDPTPLTLRVTALPNGMTSLQGERGTEVRRLDMGIRALPGRPGLFMTWFEGPQGQDISFGLLRPEADGTFTHHMPSCNLTLEILRAVHVEPGMDSALPSCVFPSRATVEEALRLFSDTMDRQSHLRFTRLPNG